MRDYDEKDKGDDPEGGDKNTKTRPVWCSERRALLGTKMRDFPNLTSNARHSVRRGIPASAPAPKLRPDFSLHSMPLSITNLK